ncbi:MAG: DUF427 domain-containing protein [Anaerolineae bacterium]|nr:DUF427 domain-containing protein [Anaerolineae bacterium]
MSDQSQQQSSQPNQESVWDYPRPPRVEPTGKRIRIVFNGVTIVDSTRAYRVLETSHPPAYYIPPEDIRMEYFNLTSRHTFCEYKGAASYWTVKVNGKTAPDCAWSYEAPSPGYETIKGCLAFYASHMDTCTVDGETVTPQAGGFYGGWITTNLAGPFKGGPGSLGW